MLNFTFQMGFLAPGQAAFRVVKYFGKPHLSFSLKRLSLGKRRRAELPARRGAQHCQTHPEQELLVLGGTGTTAGQGDW